MALQHWKRLSESVIFEHPRLTVYEDRVVLPDGTETDYLHFGTEDVVRAVIIIAVRKDGKILLQKELSYPIGDFLWQPPGGAMNAGETIEDAANRELMEEAGYRAENIEVIQTMHANNRRQGARHAVVLATSLSEASLPSDTEEYFEHYWLSPEEISTLIRNGGVTNTITLATWAIYLEYVAS